MSRGLSVMAVGMQAGGSDVVRVAVSGAAGRMGLATCAAVRSDEQLRLVAIVDPRLECDSEHSVAALSAGVESSSEPITCFLDLREALARGGIDVVVDFTVPAAVRENVLACVGSGVPAVVGTTGLSAADLAEVAVACEEGGTPVLVAPNFAMGAVLMMEFARRAADYLSSAEIVELHHDRKLDAPSGTSRLTAVGIEANWRRRGLERGVPIHSVRLPGLVAHQEVIFGGLGETLTIRHDSLSRESFMPGVVLAVKRVRGLQGLVVGLENVL